MPEARHSACFVVSHVEQLLLTTLANLGLLEQTIFDRPVDSENIPGGLRKRTSLEVSVSLGGYPEALMAKTTCFPELPEAFLRASLEK